MSVFYSTGLLLLLGWIYGGLVYIWTKVGACLELPAVFTIEALVCGVDIRRARAHINKDEWAWLDSLLRLWSGVDSLSRLWFGVDIRRPRVHTDKAR
jgi:hypothetical protein